MKDLLINAGRSSTQIFEEIMNNNVYSSKSFKVDLKDNKVHVAIKDEKNTSKYIEYVASNIASFILNFIEPKMIRDEVELECLDLFDEEIEENIVEKVEWALLHKNEQIRQTYFLNMKNDIFDGLVSHGMFNLFGFLNFRLNDRRLEIKEYISIALEDYFSDENEEQFISLIKRIVSIQKSQIDVINLILLETNKYELITGDNKRVDIEDVEKILDEYSYDEPVEQLHLILSVLMTLVPENIVIHMSKKQNPYIVQTLKKIFPTKTSTCESCDLCENMKILREEEDNLK
ncbi:gp404 [Bacillus phage G]|uniref:Gp404 n=1 Tax=Bacillus phage G TaxID=2884420 RepID=G3MAE5_9CAUD|nr:gp404 [Bacillus phage G]AEO93662.1 gp404 [Bacillus phage G]